MQIEKYDREQKDLIMRQWDERKIKTKTLWDFESTKLI